MVREQERVVTSGFVAFPILFIVLLMCIAGIAALQESPLTVAPVLLGVVDAACFFGLFVVNPNEGKVLQLFGRYVGTVRDAGWKWASPFYTKKRISLRIRNFESNKLKVNDNHGSPIEIAAVVVWRVVDTAEAAFEVDDYQNFVHVQSESALRNLATQHPYDAHEEGTVSLRGNTQEIADQLKIEIQNRLAKAGVEVM